MLWSTLGVDWGHSGALVGYGANDVLKGGVEEKVLG